MKHWAQMLHKYAVCMFPLTDPWIIYVLQLPLSRLVLVRQTWTSKLCEGVSV